MGSIEIVKIVERKADFSAQKMTIGHHACISDNSINLVNYLFIDLNVKDSYGDFDFQWAIKLKQDLDIIINLFLDYGTDVNIMNQEGYCPLVYFHY